jgi:hypothetical protein
LVQASIGNTKLRVTRHALSYPYHAPDEAACDKRDINDRKRSKQLSLPLFHFSTDFHRVPESLPLIGFSEGRWSVTNLLQRFPWTPDVHALQEFSITYMLTLSCQS